MSSVPDRYGPDAETWECPCGSVTLKTEETCRYCGRLRPDTLAARIMRSAEARQAYLRREHERSKRQHR